MVKKIIAQLIDEGIVLGLSGIGILVFDLFLKIFGYTVAMYLPVLFIIFVLFNVLYFPLLEESKYKTTIGKRVVKLDDIEQFVSEVKVEEAEVEEVKENEVLEEVKEVE